MVSQSVHTMVYYVSSMSFWISPKQDVRHKNDHLFHVTVNYIEPIMKNKYKHEDGLFLFMIPRASGLHQILLIAPAFFTS